MALPKIKNITEFKKDAANTIAEANQGRLTIISHKSGDVVLVPREEYEGFLERQETLLAFEEAEQDRASGVVGTDTDDLFATLYKKYGFADDNKVVKKSKRRS